MAAPSGPANAPPYYHIPHALSIPLSRTGVQHGCSLRGSWAFVSLAVFSVIRSGVHHHTHRRRSILFLSLTLSSRRDDK